MILTTFIVKLQKRLEPVILIGEAEYNLNVLKEIEATDSYLGLDQDVTKCQNNEPFHNCTTRKYIADALEECRCLPSNLRISEKVLHYIKRVHKHLTNRLIQGTSLCCREAGLCSQYPY